MKPTCRANVDVGFLLDSSGSLSNDYATEKDFLKVLAGEFGISPNGSRASVITFSGIAEHSIRLKDHDDFSSFMDAVDNIPLMGSTTRIDTALRLTQKEMFSLSSGARPGLPKILIVLTDGSQTQEAGSEDPGLIAEELRKSGVRVIVIGIGAGVSPLELLQLAGKETSVFSASSFEELIGGEFVRDVTKTSCEEGKILDIFKFIRKRKEMPIRYVTYIVHDVQNCSGE